MLADIFTVAWKEFREILAFGDTRGRSKFGLLILILIFGIAMHGICFGFFIVLAFMIIDEETTHDVRASAQSLYNVVIFGIGIIVGSPIAMGVLVWAKDSVTKLTEVGQYIPTHFTKEVGDYFPPLFSVMMWLALLTLVAFVFLYPRKPKMTNNQ
jgi:MFS family permease